MRDATEDALRDAAHDAFMAFWRSDACEQAALWAAYCAAQAGYEVYLMRMEQRPGREQGRRGAAVPVITLLATELREAWERTATAVE